ncbi:uncharacterized protein LOC125887711 [Epinephelus fuscoguttatus]|uniref:uncharacterized protein LOC125887711 n=1 Tax=Epinephelus fuscoguttatus TaxID=293821 RepID=UPI0020D0ACA7|nr:uncharacterized protein LOC125887711 [Epinephelus fuscoguttatus]
MSKITEAIELLIKTVEKYIAREDVWETMTKKELADLLRKEYPEANFEKLEADGDSHITFKEFVDIATDSNLMSSTTSDITKAMKLFKATFDDYAEKDSSKNTLNKSELCALLSKEFPNSPSDADISRHLPQLDGDNGVVSFNDFVTAVVLNFDL